MFFKHLIVLILQRIEAGNLWHCIKSRRRLANPKDIKLHILGSELAMEWYCSKRLDIPHSATLNGNIQDPTTHLQKVLKACVVLCGGLKMAVLIARTEQGQFSSRKGETVFS